MKKLTLLVLGLLYLISLPSGQLLAQDTISVELGDKARIIIYAKDREGLTRLRELDLNQIIRDVVLTLDTNKIEESQDVKVYEYEVDVSSNTMRLTEVDDEKVRYGREINITTFSRRNSRVFWALDLGFNNYLENGQFPDAEGAPYGLRPWGSRFVAFGIHQRTRLGKDKSPLSIQMGLEIDWFNFMFEDNNYLVEGENGVEFRDYEVDFDESLQKSKLAVSYLTIPITLNFRFKNRRGKRTFNMGFGGYGGYRIGGRTKVKLSNDDKVKNQDNFFLNNWRYGVEAQAGYRNFLLFFKYDLNPLFNDNRGPDLNAFAFGIRI